MDLSNFITVAGVIEIVLDYWAYSLLALIVFISVLVIIFKGWKRGLKLFVFLAVLAGLVAAGLAVTYFALHKPLELISFSVAWVPTILFVAIILVSTLFGVWRGFRKSAILLVHALCVGGLCIGLYFFCISSTQVDAWLLSVVNHFMGGSSALQNALGVGTGCETLREVFAEYVPALFGYGTEAAILAQGSSAYVMTLVDMAYRMAFAFIFCAIYQILVFLLYVVYHIFYSERKYRRKKNLAFHLNKTDASYRKHRVGGGVIGFARGLCVGFISLSFIGSAFYIAAGGTGDGDLAEYKFGNKDADFAFSVYRSIESYGTQGIFKILNTVKDPGDTPYYLFAADLILSGGLEDEANGISETIKFREELGAYMGFARDTMNLLMLYGEEDLMPVLNGESSEDAMSVVVDIMSDPSFQLEFANLIDNFDSKTYIINLSFSLANTVIANIDDMSFMSSVSDDNKELLKVLFEDGYLTDVIPDERELKEELNTSVITDSKEKRPCFRLNHLLTKQDAQIVMKVVLSFLTDEDTLSLTKQILPQIEQLSIFGSKRKEEMDPVLARMYCYLENKYLTVNGEDGITYKQVSREKISWGEEIRTLIGVAEHLLTLYDNVGGGQDYLQMLLAVFDDENELYEQNLELYDRICAAASDSALMGKVLSSGYMMQSIADAMLELGETVYIPDKIRFENQYDEAGALISHGEMYQFFYGVRLLGEKENKDLLDAIFNSFSDMEVSEVLDLLADAIVIQDKFGNTLSDYLTDSVLLRSAISTVFIEQGADDLIVPLGSLERNYFDLPVNLIRKEDLRGIFVNLPQINEILSPLLEDAGTEEVIAQFVKGRDLFSESYIIAASVVNYIVQSDEFRDILRIPAAYLMAGSRERLYAFDEYNLWNGELTAFAAALDEIFGITEGAEFSFTQEDVSDKMFSLLKSMNCASFVSPEKTKAELCYDSEIIRNDLTFELDDALTGNVDGSVMEAVKQGPYYKLAEIEALSDALNQLEIQSFDELENYDASEINRFNEPSETHPGNTRLDVMYESVIVCGMITSSVQDSMKKGNGVLVDHKNAYRTDVAVYKKNEIEALITLLGDSELEEYELGRVSELRACVEPDAAGEPRSYLVAAAVSENLLGNGDLIIPAGIVSERLVSADEIIRLMDAYSALNGDGRLDDWSVAKDMVLPAIAHRETVVASTVMRATMTHTLVARNGRVEAAYQNVVIDEDCRGAAVAVLCEEQLLALFSVLDVCGTRELDIPVFRTIEDLAGSEGALSVFYAFDATRYNISRILEEYADAENDEGFEQEEVYRLTVGSKVNVSTIVYQVLSYESAQEILAKYA